ncbi:MAG: hypothetical protein CM15mV121_010 [uncultured marine virus]|nr:MAG: hypothetical protein CM15mV121_010 [uncultured marine virus]
MEDLIDISIIKNRNKIKIKLKIYYDLEKTSMYPFCSGFKFFFQRGNKRKTKQSTRSGKKFINLKESFPPKVKPFVLN